MLAYVQGLRYPLLPVEQRAENDSHHLRLNWTNMDKFVPTYRPAQLAISDVRTAVQTRVYARARLGILIML